MMKSWLTHLARSLALTLTVPIVACGADESEASGAEPRRLVSDIEPLREAFNQDVGRHRLIMLLSPT